MTIPLLALLGPPLFGDRASLVVKSGVQSASWYGVSGAVHMWIGTGSRIAVILVLAVAAVGTLQLWRSHRRLVTYYVVCTASLVLAVVLSRGAHVGEPIVLLVQEVHRVVVATHQPEAPPGRHRPFGVRGVGFE